VGEGGKVSKVSDAGTVSSRTILPDELLLYWQHA
jgi:hypothetical protein